MSLRVFAHPKRIDNVDLPLILHMILRKDVHQRQVKRPVGNAVGGAEGDADPAEGEKVDVGITGTGRAFSEEVSVGGALDEGARAELSVFTLSDGGPITLFDVVGRERSLGRT